MRNRGRDARGAILRRLKRDSVGRWGRDTLVWYASTREIVLMDELAHLRVRDVMSRDVKTLGRNDQLSLADDMMRVGRIRHLPVLDEEGASAGCLSQRDMFRGARAQSVGYGTTVQQKVP